jgi:hypothetical protein
MHLFNLMLAAMVALAPPAHDQGGPLYEATGRDPYFQGKLGFHQVSQARDHAFKDFQAEVSGGRIDPSRDEFFSYIYTFQDPGSHAPRIFFHSQWRPAEFERTEAGSIRHLARSPIAETPAIRIYTMIHSHPTALKEGAGPSRVDLATASKYKHPDGRYRYLYLINNRGKLIRFKARRDINPNDPAALSRLPLRPRVTVDWVD